MRRTGRFLRRLERASWALGIVLTLGYGGVRLTLEAARAGAVEAFRHDTATPDSASSANRTPEPRRTVPASGAIVDQSLWSPQRVLAFAASAAAAASGRAPDAVLGVLRIPSLRLEVPVYEGATEINLNRGAAHIRGTAPFAASGNIGIAAHRDGFFRKLKDVAIDAEVVLDTVDGSARYRVVDIGIVEPTDVQVLAKTAVPSVTLVTCYPFYFVGHAPLRYVVRAELTDPQDAVLSDGSKRRFGRHVNSRSGT